MNSCSGESRNHGGQNKSRISATTLLASVKPCSAPAVVPAHATSSSSATTLLASVKPCSEPDFVPAHATSSSSATTLLASVEPCSEPASCPLTRRLRLRPPRCLPAWSHVQHQTSPHHCVQHLEHRSTLASSVVAKGPISRTSLVLNTAPRWRAAWWRRSPFRGRLCLSGTAGSGVFCRKSRNNNRRAPAPNGISALLACRGCSHGFGAGFRSWGQAYRIQFWSSRLVPSGWRHARPKLNSVSLTPFSRPWGRSEFRPTHEARPDKGLAAQGGEAADAAFGRQAGGFQGLVQAVDGHVAGFVPDLQPEVELGGDA